MSEVLDVWTLTAIAVVLFFLGTPVVVVLATWVIASSYFIVDFPLANVGVASSDSIKSFIFCCCCSAFNCACVVDIPIPPPPPPPPFVGTGPFHAVSGGGPSGALGPIIALLPLLPAGANVTTHAFPSIALLFKFSAQLVADCAVVNSTTAHPFDFPFFFSVKNCTDFTTPNSLANCSTCTSVVHHVKFATYTDLLFSSSSSFFSALLVLLFV